MFSSCDIIPAAADARSMAQRASRLRAVRLAAPRLPDHTKDRTQPGPRVLRWDRSDHGSPLFSARSMYRVNYLIIDFICQYAYLLFFF